VVSNALLSDVETVVIRRLRADATTAGIGCFASRRSPVRSRLAPLSKSLKNRSFLIELPSSLARGNKKGTSKPVSERSSRRAEGRS
jgi:hypothetical protein